MRLTSVDLPDPIGDQLRIRDVIVRLLGRAQVPFAKSPEKERQDGADAAAELFARDIIFIAPHPAHRRVAVADMNRIAATVYALCIAGAAAEDQIIVSQI